MARIAEATCETCHHVRPRTEMRQVAVNRKVGTRFGISHSRRNTRESASVQFRRERVWVCKGCRAPRSDGLIPWKTLAALVMAFVGYAWFTDAGTKRSVARGVDAAITAAGPHVDPIEKGRSAVKALLSTAAAKEDERAPDPDYTPPAEADEAAPALDWGRDEIAEARLKALEVGSAKWKAKGVKGQVVASEATRLGPTECRNVYSTARIDGRTETSPTTTWCRQEGGAWSRD